MNRSARGSSGLLDAIVAAKRSEVAALAPHAPQLERAAAARPAPPAFLEPAGTVALIAEVKRRSPSAGDLRPTVSVVNQAAGYERGGAAAVSVLTDGPYFGGSLADLEEVAARVTLPLLRKDFTLDRLQLLEARAAGAAAVLLIASILDDATLRTLHAAARALGLAALVEVHDGAELDRALAAGALLVGVNNRNLDTLTIDLSVTERLAAHVPADVVLVGESGVRSRADVERLAAAGVDAVLVGETLMRGEDAEAGVRALTGVARRGR